MMRKVILAPMLVLTILLLTSSLLFTVISDGVESENYVVLENGTNTISVVNSASERTIIYHIPGEAIGFNEMVIDSSGNYIVTVGGTTNTLSKVTPTGISTVIYTLSAGQPTGVKIDSSGNYVVCEYDANILSKVTPDGVRTLIYAFSEGNGPSDVAIDSAGNYIIAEYNTKVLSKITPTGERTVIYTFPEAGSHPNVVVIDSSGNYIVTDSGANTLSKVTPSGERTVIYTFSAGTEPMGVAIDSSGNYIVTEFRANTLSKVTPTGVRTVIYTFPTGTYPLYVLISTAPELFFSDITENGLTATWTQSTDPSFAGYQLYQSTTQGELGTLIGTNTNVADTSLAITGLSPWTTYYFTLRVLGANGAHVDYGQRSMTTAKAFWQQIWFQGVMVVVVIVAVAAVAIYVVHSRSKKRSQVT